VVPKGENDEDLPDKWANSVKKIKKYCFSSGIL
jgi:hypothetical protein